MIAITNPNKTETIVQIRASSTVNPDVTLVKILSNDIIHSPPIYLEF